MFSSISLLLILVLLLGGRVISLDDGQGKIEEEKGANEDERDEEKEGPGRVGLLVHDHNLTPALERDALEDIKERPEDIVEVRHIIVGIERLFTAVGAYWAH